MILIGLFLWTLCGSNWGFFSQFWFFFYSPSMSPRPVVYVLIIIIIIIITSTIVIIINIAIVNTSHTINGDDAHAYGCFSELPQPEVCDSETHAEPFHLSK